MACVDPCATGLPEEQARAPCVGPGLGRDLCACLKLLLLMVYGVWRVESFTRLGSPLGFFWVTPQITHWVTGWVTRWVTGWVRFAATFRAVLLGDLDAPLSLGDLRIYPIFMAKSVVSDREELLGNLACCRFVGR